MPKLALGVIKFQKEEFPKREELFSNLAEGQAPETLFIACSDSRVDPSLITQTEPGELFICRNAGNIVPPHTNATGAMTASIEFAVAALQVKHIVVCGHSQCGAMKGALDLDGLNELPHVREWLGFARAAVLAAREKGSDSLSEADHLDLVTRENVVLQMTHLRTHPSVAARLVTGKLKIHGWVYDIKHGGMLAFDERTGEFGPVAEVYRDIIAETLEV